MQNFLDPAILFFVFGLLAGAVRSNLEIPPQIARFLSLYLLMALGLKGGFALAKSGLTTEIAVSLGLALLLAVLVPAVGYLVLRRLLSRFDAAAVAATYGSVSAVTFITATQYLESHAIAFGGHMAAAMALMESPAIVMAVLLANLARRKEGSTAAAELPGLRKVLHESFTDGAQLLLLGAMAVGLITGDAGKQAMQPFSGDLFKGMLAFFLLDMGLLAARNLGAWTAEIQARAGVSCGANLGAGEALDRRQQRAGNDEWPRKSPRPEGLAPQGGRFGVAPLVRGPTPDGALRLASPPLRGQRGPGFLPPTLLRSLRGRSPWLLGYALGAPLVHASVALGLAALCGLSAGNATLLMVLAASASYIAVPAVVRVAIPEANPSLYFGMSLGLTFPFNILLGIPLYSEVAQRLL